MTVKDVMRETMATARMCTEAYLGDLTDAELMMRPAPNSNHIAWQLGHLIASERQMLTTIGKTMPELPAGFAEQHSREACGSDDASRFATRQQYLDLMKQVRAATLAALEATPDSEFDRPGPEAMRAYAPTIGSVFNLIGMHELMHVGQYVPLRRRLGKPVTI